MKLLKTTAVLLLLVQTLQLASLQSTTNSLRPTVKQSWWRELPMNEIPKQDVDGDQGNDTDYSGIASGSMAVNSEEELNVAGETKETEYDLTTASPQVVHGDTTKKHKHHKTTVSPTTKAANSNHSVDTKEGNSTATSQNSTGSSDVPSNAAQNSTTEFANGTGSANATSAPNPAAPDQNETATNSSTGDFPSKTSDQNSTDATNTTGNGTTDAIPNIPENATTAIPNVPEDITSAANPNTPENATSAAPVPPEKSNNTGKSDGGSGSSSDRGVASDPNKSTRKGAWGAVLGTGVAVALVGLVVYVILKKRHHKAFSHRKLVEDFPADPVHRLDNNEPLDLNFGGSAYYNPGLQGDNIQMSNIPGRP